MRHVFALPAIGLAAVLSGCHGNTVQGTPTATPPPPTYSIGGSIAGLSGSVVLQNNGGDNLTLSSNGTFALRASGATSRVPASSGSSAATGAC